MRMDPPIATKQQLQPVTLMMRRHYMQAGIKTLPRKITLWTLRQPPTHANTEIARRSSFGRSPSHTVLPVTVSLFSEPALPEIKWRSSKTTLSYLAHSLQKFSRDACARTSNAIYAPPALCRVLSPTDSRCISLVPRISTKRQPWRNCTSSHSRTEAERAH